MGKKHKIGKEEIKQLLILLFTALFFMGSVMSCAYRVNKKMKVREEKRLAQKVLSEDQLEPEDVFRRELETMNSIALLLEDAFKAEKISDEQKNNILNTAKKWKILMDKKREVPAEKQKEILLELGKEPKDVLERMHKAQAAILTKKEGHELMLMIKVVLDDNSPKLNKNREESHD